MEKTDKPKTERAGIEEKKGRKGLGHTGEEKCRAVLSVWTERRRAGEICREMGIAWALLNQWQGRAMEGMLLALRPAVEAEKGVALPPRLAVLLEKKNRQGSMKGLERRLARMQRSQARAVETKESLAEKKV